MGGRARDRPTTYRWTVIDTVRSIAFTVLAAVDVAGGRAVGLAVASAWRPRDEEPPGIVFSRETLALRVSWCEAPLDFVGVD